MKPKIIVLIFSIFFSATVFAAEQGSQCSAHDGSKSKCMPLAECPVLMQIIRESVKMGYSQDEAINILMKSTCGYVQSEPIVCCPIFNKSEYPEQDLNDSTASDTESTSPKLNVNLVTTTQATTTTKLSSKITSPPKLTGQTKVTPKPKPNQAPKSPSESADESNSSGKTTTTKKPPKKFINSPETQPKSTTTTEAPTTLFPVNPDKLKLLPEECGRVLSFKFFRGNKTEFDDFPWTTLVGYDTPWGKRFACGGALISKRYVLTAAQCIDNVGWTASSVRFGEYDTDSEIDCLSDGDNSTVCMDKPIDVPIEELIVYPGYKIHDRSQLHNIALLRLARDITFTEFVKPICLPFAEPTPQRYYTSGWGKNRLKNGTYLKYMSYITLDEPKHCAEIYESLSIYVRENQLCGGVKQYEKSCIGDYGGPLMGVEEKANQMKRVTAFGILSMTMPAIGSCELSKFPGLYTKVLDYMPWILNQLKE